MANDQAYPGMTRRSGYRYIFTGKHHGGGSSTDARWLESITRDDEFAVFDNADWFEISHDDGWVYGVWAEEGELHDLGTWGQQMAEFPATRGDDPWHGYPIWAVNQEAPDNRRGEKLRPAKRVFGKLEAAGLITARQRKRLWKGDHV